jgi:uncharacterized delta-60 repeat protein
LDTGRDGIRQIADILSAYRNLSAIHIVSHGTPGQVILGTGTLSPSSLNGYADDLAVWGESLAEEGDILLYGCSVGAGPAGGMLIEGLADLTGADVTASIDATGPAELGGNWVLETATGPVEASSLDHGMIAGVRGLLGPGDLDPTFGTPGKVTTNIDSYDYGRSVALQSDGKIVVAGDTFYRGFARARYNPNGSLDRSFGGTGRVTTSQGDGGYAVAVQSDGKIVVAGASYNDDFAVARYNTDGSLDTSLGGRARSRRPSELSLIRATA